MSDTVLRPASAGLAGLLTALRPVLPGEAPPPPDLDALRATAWADGFGAGRAAADADLGPLRDHLTSAAAAFDTARTIDVDTLRPLLAGLVRHVAEAVLAHELRADTALLALAGAALEQVRPGDVPTLRAHPDTLAVLSPHVGIPTAADPALPRDGFAITGTDFVIDVNIAARLTEIMTESV